MMTSSHQKLSSRSGFPILFGFLLASSVLTEDLLGQRVIRTHYGISSQDRTAGAVCSIGDLDGDGVPDYAVGTRYSDIFATDAGSLRVHSGASGDVLFLLTGDSEGDWFGNTVGRVGDLNADGIPDFVVGSPLDDLNGADAGSAFVFSGADATVLFHWTGDRDGDWFGYWASEAGDVNGDGTPDVIIGAYLGDIGDGSETGMARVFSGADGAIFYTWYGDHPGEQFGWWVTDAGDIDQDGHADVAVGAPHGGYGGYIRIFSGWDGSILRNRVDPNGGGYGFTVNNAGDLDLDGVDDLIASNPFSYPGYCEVLSGATGNVLYRLEGHPLEWDLFGCRAADAAGDLNGDGVPDIVVAAYRDPTNGYHAGKVTGYSGVDGSPLLSALGDDDRDWLGFFAAGAGDIDSDGCDDILACATQWWETPPGHGYLRIIAGDSDPFRLEEPAPGIAGTRNTLTVGGVRRSGLVVFFAGLLPGKTLVPAGHGGIAIVNISDAVFSAVFRPDQSGQATGQWFVPSSFAWTTVRLQAVEWNTGRFSNLVEYTFQ
jgi:hypothetical protein